MKDEKCRHCHQAAQSQASLDLMGKITGVCLLLSWKEKVNVAEFYAVRSLGFVR